MNRKPLKRQRFVSINSTLIIVGILLLAIYFVTVKIHRTRQPSVVNDTAQSTQVSLAHLELPAQIPKEEIVVHTGYTLSYNEENEQANWVAYKLTKEEEVNAPHFTRTNNFMKDPMVT